MQPEAAVDSLLGCCGSETVSDFRCAAHPSSAGRFSMQIPGQGKL